MRMVSMGNQYDIDDVFKDLFTSKVQYEEDLILTEQDVLVFGGGQDICPAIYGAKGNRYNGAIGMSMRDVLEVSAIKRAKEVGAKFIGICRGAQLLCATSGGSLVQHVTNHGVWEGHDITTVIGEKMRVSSTHHQMMNPDNTNHIMIGWSSEPLSTCYLVDDDVNIEMSKEPEIVYFKDSRALAMQYHPEFMSKSDRGYKYARELVEEYIR